MADIFGTGPGTATAYWGTDMFHPTQGIPSSPYGGGGFGGGQPTLGGGVGNIGGGNILGTGGIPYMDLAKQLNDFMAGQAKRQYELNMPGYTGLTQKFSDLTGQQLAGQLSPDVIYQIGKAAAQRGAMSGSPLGPSTNADYLAAIGLTSRDEQARGAANLHQGIADTPVSPTWNPASLFVPEYLAQKELQAAQHGASRLGGGWNTPSFQNSAPSSRYAPPTQSYNYTGGGGGGTTRNLNPSYGLPVSSTDPEWQYAEPRYGLGDDWSTMFDDLGGYGNTGGGLLNPDTGNVYDYFSDVPTSPGQSDFSDWWGE